MTYPLDPLATPADDGRRPVVPCDVYEPMLGPHLDRELTRAEEVRLEAHLDACGRCRKRLARLEGLSSVLRAWDTGSAVEAEPRPRIQNAVLARVAETSHRRRVDDRVLRMMHLAAAACVLLALGLGIAFGVAWEPATSTPEAVALADVSFDAEALASLDLPAPLADLPSLAVTRDVQALRGLEREARPVDEVIERTALDTAQLARLEVFARRLGREQAVEARVGESAVHVTMGDGEERVLSVSAYRFAAANGWFARWRRPTHETVAPSAPSSASPGEVRDGSPIGLAVRDMLRPIPGLEEGSSRSIEEASPILVSPSSPGSVAADSRLVIRGIPQHQAKLRSGDRIGAPVDALDPLRAQREGWLRFDESGVDPDTLVAFVRGNPKPILIPAGQLLAGGITDRMVAEPILLPAAPDMERRENVPCRVVRVGTRREVSAPILTEWIAGPTIRALLSRGAPDAELQRAVEAQVRTRMGSQPQHLAAFSLLELFQSHEGPAHPWVARALAAVRTDRSAWTVEHQAGFVALDGLDGVLGIEVVRLKGAAGTALLTRLYVGYLLEAAMRQQGSTIGEAGVALDAGFELFQRDDSPFLGARESAPGVTPSHRLSTLDLARAGLRFQAFEVSGRPVLVSAAPSK